MTIRLMRPARDQVARLIPVLLLAAGSTGCLPNDRAGEPGASPGATAGELAADTVRGVVQLVGSEPGTWVVLESDVGVFTLHGDRDDLERVLGLEVTVWGEPEDGVHFQAFRVDRFAVRAADGIPATDGVLGIDDAGYYLVTGDGERVPVPHLPADLRGREGDRVWLTGPLHRHPASYGVIRPSNP